MVVSEDNLNNTYNFRATPKLQNSPQRKLWRMEPAATLYLKPPWRFSG